MTGASTCTRIASTEGQPVYCRSFREAMIGGDKMTIVALEATNLCSYTDDQKPEYVFFTGGIAGISDSQT